MSYKATHCAGRISANTRHDTAATDCYLQAFQPFSCIKELVIVIHSL